MRSVTIQPFTRPPAPWLTHCGIAQDRGLRLVADQSESLRSLGPARCERKLQVRLACFPLAQGTNALGRRCTYVGALRHRRLIWLALLWCWSPLVFGGPLTPRCRLLVPLLFRRGHFRSERSIHLALRRRSRLLEESLSPWGRWGTLRPVLLRRLCIWPAFRWAGRHHHRMRLLLASRLRRLLAVAFTHTQQRMRRLQSCPVVRPLRLPFPSGGRARLRGHLGTRNSSNRCKCG